MFLKNSPATTAKASGGKREKETIPSIITQDVNLLGNVISDGNVDFDGTLNGNIRCNTLTIRANGFIKGEAIANNILVYGRVKGLIRAKNVQLFASCNVEGVIMHETIAIEDGAFVDGKFKRTDRISNDEHESADIEFSFAEEDESDDSAGGARMLENIRLIR